MADLLNINMNAGEVIAALDEYGDFSAGMTATEFVGEVNTAFPDADAELTDTASELVGKVNNAQPSPIPEGTVLKFLHYSDPHTQKGATEKATKIMGDSTDADYDEDVKFALLTGDNQIYGSTTLADAINAADNGKHLLMMGNHDASDYYGRTAEGHAQMVEDVKSYMTQGGVTYGGDSDVVYWYKDFTVEGLPTGAKVRVIGTDEYEVGGSGYAAFVTKTQIDWLIARIDELGKDDYFIVATHQPPFYGNKANATSTARANKFCWVNPWGWDVYNTVMDIFSDVVKAYKNGESYNNSTLGVSKDWSGKTNQAAFLGFPCGHVHADYHGGVPKTGYEDLLVMCIDTSKQVGSDSGDFAAATRQAAKYVCINKVTVDFHAKTIRIDRIGCMNVQAQTVDGVTYPAFTRDNITFDFDANVVQEGGES